MKAIRFSYIIPVLLVLGLASCKDNEPEVIVENADPASVCQSAATYNSLTFSWDKIKGVNQYGYELTDADGATVAEGVTEFNKVTIEDLKTDAPYTFELRVFGAYGEPSYRTTIEARTLPIRQLDQPQVTSKQEGNRIVLTWPAVEGAASYLYTYSIGDNVITEETAENSCSIAGLAPGEHTVTVMSVSDYDGYTDSETVAVKVERTRKEVGSVQGTYTSGLMRRNNSWAATMHVFDDGTYMIESFYQGEGYNLDFYVDQDASTDANFIGIYNFVSYPDCEYYVMDTGRASVPQIDMIPGLSSGEYGSTFIGDAGSGTLTINTRYSTASGTDTFEW